jgi:hypothetical protein
MPAMAAVTRHRTHRRTLLASIGVTAWSVALLTLLAVPAERAIAAKTSTLVQPSSTGEAKIARQQMLAERKTVVGVRKPHPGKTVGGTSTPLPKTIVTKGFLPK